MRREKELPKSASQRGGVLDPQPTLGECHRMRRAATVMAMMAAFETVDDAAELVVAYVMVEASW